MLDMKFVRENPELVMDAMRTVSYKHLTLPTIASV